MTNLCNNQEEDQIHVLQECSVLEQLNIQKTTKENIFNENIKAVKETKLSINNIIEKVKKQLTTKKLEYSSHHSLSYLVIWVCTQT